MRGRIGCADTPCVAAYAAHTADGRLAIGDANSEGAALANYYC